jgi:hypothetical protein
MTIASTALPLSGELLIESREHFVFDEADVPRRVPNPYYRPLAPGALITQDVAAPGIGRATYRITRVDAAGAWGICVASTVRDLTIDEVR